MLSLRYKSKRQDCKETCLSSVNPLQGNRNQWKASVEFSKHQNFTNSRHAALTGVPHAEEHTPPILKKKRRNSERKDKHSRMSLTSFVQETHLEGVDRIELEKKIRQEQTRGESGGCKSGEGQVQKKHKRKNKKRQPEKQQWEQQLQGLLNSRTDKPERKRCLQGNPSHSEDSKPSNSVQHFTAYAGLCPLQHQDKNNRQTEFIPGQQQEWKRLHMLKQFANRGMSASGSATLLKRLQGGRFRSLNEFLYTKQGKEALAQYQKDPKLFDLYHAGYRAQLRRWPLNPLDSIAHWLEKQPKHWITGDFGCGEATLALRFPDRKFYSFDLVAANERITACDISNVPLANKSLDVAVFCLSLMGRDWPAFLREAHRVLKPRGYLVIAEVSSRIDSLPEFIAAIEGLGFKNNKQEDLASFFILLEFSTEKRSPSRRTPELVAKLLQPCIYKRR